MLGGLATSSIALAASAAEAGAEAELDGEAASTVGSAIGPAIYTSAAAAVGAADLADLYNDLTKTPAEARPLKKRPAAEAEAVALMLDVTVNGAPLPEVAMGEVTPDGDLILPESFWAAARLKRPAKALQLSSGEPGYGLDSVTGLTYSLDLAQLALTIAAPPSAFLPGAINIGRDRRPLPKSAPPGGYLNYDVTATRSSDGTLGYGGMIDAVLFNGWGSLVNRAVFRGNNRGRDLNAVRTETFWQKDLPGQMMSLVVGDTISSNGGWSQPVRYGGVRVGRNFGLAPSFITFPLPSISGSAALPSTVDVLINSSKARSDLKVTPGAFDITGVPVVTGAGQINLVVTDLRGVQSVITRDYYSSARLLAPGLSDFSFEAGALRRDFGSRSNAYGPGFVSASWRQGVTPGLTLQGRFELQEDRQAVGGDAVFKLGNIALARSSVSYASGRLSPGSGPDSGWHYIIGIERLSRHGSITAEWEHFDKGFEQFGNYASFSRPRDRLRVGAGISPFSGISVGASYIDQKTWEGDRYRIVSGNIGVSLPAGFNLSAYAADQLSGQKGWSFGLNLTKSLGRQRSAAATLNRSNSGDYSKRLTVSQSAPIGPGLGWRIEASDNRDQELRAGVTLNIDAAQLSADMDIRPGFNAVRVGASGSVGWMKGLPFVSREINGRSFAVVKVGNLPGVKVYRANQYAATTNENGLALVTGLLPYEENLISLEADELPFNVEISGTEDNAVPYARSGVFIDIPVKRSLNALAKLQSASGEPLPIGSTVRVDNGQEFVVGRRGEVYLTDLSASNALDITWTGGTCRVRLSIDPKATEEAVVGPIICGASR